MYERIMRRMATSKKLVKYWFKREMPPKLLAFPLRCKEQFNSFSLDDNNLLYLDERLVIPKDMRDNMSTAKHFGHAGGDAMLREAADVWCPRIHREIVERANNCPQCCAACKNLTCLKPQKVFGKILVADELNEEISIECTSQKCTC